MASVTDDLYIFLAAQLPAENIRVGYLPTGPDKAIALRTIPGEEPIASFVGQCRKTMEVPIVSVLARGNKDDYREAEALSASAYDELHNIVGQTINGTRYSCVEALQIPYHFGIDEQSRHIFGFSLRCWKNA